MTAKVLINTREGTIQIEGDSDFVKEVYSDFKHLIMPAMQSIPLPAEETFNDTSGGTATKPKTRKKSGARKASNSDSSGAGVNPDNPSLDKHLDTTGVREFYAQYAPKNHPEKILIFARFLKDKKGVESANTDQIYTCYNAVGEKPAAAFAQSFRDTSSRKFGYIEYKSATDISLTFIGNRHFDHDLKKKGAE
jgi:hypothetical protein